MNTLTHRHKRTKRNQHPYHIVPFLPFPALLTQAMLLIYFQRGFSSPSSLKGSTPPLSPSSHFPSESHVVGGNDGGTERKAKRTLKSIANEIYASDRSTTERRSNKQIPGDTKQAGAHEKGCEDLKIYS